jgi:hypothetical protein
MEELTRYPPEKVGQHLVTVLNHPAADPMEQSTAILIIGRLRLRGYNQALMDKLRTTQRGDLQGQIVFALRETTAITDENAVQTAEYLRQFLLENPPADVSVRLHIVEFITQIKAEPLSWAPRLEAQSKSESRLPSDTEASQLQQFSALVDGITLLCKNWPQGHSGLADTIIVLLRVVFPNRIEDYLKIIELFAFERLSPTRIVLYLRNTDLFVAYMSELFPALKDLLTTAAPNLKTSDDMVALCRRLLDEF